MSWTYGRAGLALRGTTFGDCILAKKVTRTPTQYQLNSEENISVWNTIDPVFPENSFHSIKAYPRG
jgi:hypothetical protein